MTADPYTGVRTRENIVQADSIDDDLNDRVAVLQGAIAEYRAGTRTTDPLAVPPPVPPEDPQATIARQKVLIEDMKHDWDKLNEFFNITAQRREWCSDYEGRLLSYNEHFRVLKMVGRPTHWVGTQSTWRTAEGIGHGENG